MQFTMMSVWLFTGLAVLTAGVLAVLQYLRIRPRQVRVVTTLFWEQAADEARARTFFERFRHPRTYLLLLAICLLSLLALAGPIFDDSGTPHRVIVLEAGLGMTASDGRFERALEIVRMEANAVAEHRVAVVIADPRPRLLKHFDESLAVLESRLKRLEAADAPVMRRDILGTAACLLAHRDHGETVLVTAEPTALDEPMLRVVAAGEALDNAFILSALFVPESTDLTCGDFRCQVGFNGKQDGDVVVEIARQDEVLLKRTVGFEPGQTREFTVADVAADGRRITASVSGCDALGGDSKAVFQLPDRRRIAVVPVDDVELPSVLTSVVDSLAEVAIGEANEENRSTVHVGPIGSNAEIQIQHVTPDGDWVAVRPGKHPLLEGMAFEDALCRASKARADLPSDTVPLLVADGLPVAGLNPEGDRLTVANTLFDTNASLVRRTGYMVFWSKMLHHLAGWRDEPLTLSPKHSYRSTDAAAVDLALKADMDDLALKTPTKVAVSAEFVGPRLSIWQWLLTAVLALMVLEAVLNLRERIT